jgi:archaellum biogenesis ATPase FlaH
MVAATFSNEEIMAALEAVDPIIMDAKDPRRKRGMPECDKIARQRTMEAIRSVRFKITGDDKDINTLVGLAGTGSVKSIADVDYENMPRFSSGMDTIDYLYGQTVFVHLSGPKKGQPTGEVQIGLPAAFMSIWGGSPGVGKSRLAIALTKSLNKKGKKVLYLNGEASESQFRMWCGMDVDPKLFLVRTTDCMRLEMVVADILTHKPDVVIADSVQMILAAGGILAVLTRLKMLKNDPAAGLPHVILISQLNKKGELKGNTLIEHLVDCCAKVTRIEGRQGQFRVAIERKNRGGITPRYASFRHMEHGIEAISQLRTPDKIDLVRPAGVAAAADIPEEPDAIEHQFVPVGTNEDDGTEE